MKRVFSLLALLLVSFKVLSYGISDFDNETPYGNRIYNPGGYTNFSFTKSHQEIKGLVEWYFYKGHTIGKLYDGYFIIDEKNSKSQIFTDSNEWNEQIDRLGLKPKLWTRWYSTDWILYDELLIILIFGFYITIPLFIAFLWIFYQAVAKERFNVRKPFTIISIVVLCIALAVMLADLYPMSI